MSARRLVALALLVLSSAARAAPPELPERWKGANAWRLDLAEALRLAARQNLGVVLARENALVADLGVRLSAGAFEPNVTASYLHGDTDSPPVTSQEGDPGEIVNFVQDAWRVAAAERFGTGTSLELALDGARARSTAGTAVQPLNYRSQVELTLSQPVLRGFSPDLVIPRVEVLRARLASERAREETAVALREVILATESAYWDVVRALEGHRVQRDSLRRAEEQAALTRRQIDAGVLAPSDLIDAESTLAQRRLALVQADAAVEEAWDALRRAMNAPREGWARPIVPITEPRFVEHRVSAEESLALALEHRPELRQLELDLRRVALDVRKADNDRLPQIDVGASYALVGQDRSWRGTLNRIGEATAPGWSVLLTLTWTPLQRASRAAAEIERARQRVAAARKEQRILELYAEVRAAVRNLDTAAREVEAAAAFHKLAAENLDVEQRKFLNGTSSNFLVGQRQEGVAQAELAELEALLRHQKAALALDAATGLLLESRGIRLEVGR